MKNNIFLNVLRGLIVVLALVEMDSVGAEVKPLSLDPWSTSGQIDAAGPEAMQPDQGKLTADFNQIISTSWNPSYEEKIDEDWAYFHKFQKMAILQHMYNQGLLSKWLLNSPRRFDVIPEPKKSNQEFEDIMANPWNSNQQDMINGCWYNWNDGERYAIIQRICDQGLIAPSEAKYWILSNTPQVETKQGG